MSYEGYSQLLCENGHLDTIDCNDTLEECVICNAPIVWENMVDETNCDSVGYIDMSKYLLKDAVYKTCDMNHRHKVSEETYRIPTVEEKLAERNK